MNANIKIYENMDEFLQLQEELYIENANWAFCCAFCTDNENLIKGGNDGFENRKCCN
jgi:hypothetical protein